MQALLESLRRLNSRDQKRLIAWQADLVVFCDLIDQVNSGDAWNAVLAAEELGPTALRAATNLGADVIAAQIDQAVKADQTGDDDAAETALDDLETLVDEHWEALWTLAETWATQHEETRPLGADGAPLRPIAR